MVKAPLSATRLLGLSNDIIDISKIESAKLEFKPREYEIISLLNDVVALNNVRIGNKPVAFCLELDETLPSRLYGDDLKIKQIINNLFSNAIKYTKEGEIHFSVFRGCVPPVSTPFIPKYGDGHQPNNDIYLTFSVRDSGFGFKAEVTIRQSLIYPSMPKPIGRENAALMENLIFINRYLLQENSKRLQMPEVRVLVVDDVLSNLEVAKGFLSLYGMKVDFATNGEEAINILWEKAALYDLVFLEHMMDGINGQEVIKFLRKEIGGVNAGSLPVIALSANAPLDSREMFLDMGFQDFLPKPINALNLDSVLKKWIPEHKIEGIPDTVPAKSFCSSWLIDGVNVARGLENSGYDYESYRYMLESFCKDLPENLSFIRHIIYAIENNGDFEKTDHVYLLRTIFRNIKKSSLSIGADAFAAEACNLEEKLKTEGISIIQDEFLRFSRNLQYITDRIREKLDA